MALSEEKKNSICKDFNDIALGALENGSLKASELQSLSTLFIEKLDLLENENQLPDLFRELSQKWPHFKGLKTIAEGKLEEKTEAEVASGVSTLIQSGKIDDALKLAKTETQNN